MTDLSTLTLTEAKAGLSKKDFSSVELTTAVFDRIDQNQNLNAYVTLCKESALNQAQESDVKISQGQAGKLEGLPLGIKDNFLVKGVRATAGSRMLENFIAPYESTVTTNLLREGAVFTGKLNMDEFAMGSATINSYFGPTINPWRSLTEPHKDLVPGGSSGGSSSAVAGHLCLAATGTDTGGSIRQPAALTGTVGLKPTYGLCSRRGIVAFASSLDQAGPITKTVDDAALMLEVMASFDPQDATSEKVNIPSYLQNLNPCVKGKKIGLPKEYVEQLSGDASVLLGKGIDWLKQAGATIVDISLPLTDVALPSYYIIAPAEASANLARYDGIRFGYRGEGKGIDDIYKNTREDGFGWEVKRRILIGTYVLSAGYVEAYYLKAQKVRRLIQNDFTQAFKDVDLILTPTTKDPAFGIHDKITDPIAMYLNDIFTVTANLADLPAISVPAGLSQSGLPLGLQLIGPKFSEQSLLDAAKVLEIAANFKRLG